MGGCCGAQEVTVMVLSVNLQCYQCYWKVKKLLCKFPQIRNQVYDEKQNTVTITVVSCSPERIRDMLCAKGGKSIKSIDIKEPKKADPEPKPKPADKKPQTEKPAGQKCKNGCGSVPVCCDSCCEGIPCGPCYQPGWHKPEKPAKPAPAPPKHPDPAPAPPCLPGPPTQVYPVPVCCDSCCEGIPCRPCYQAGWHKPEKPAKPAPAPPKHPDPAPAPPCLPGPPPHVYPVPVYCDSCYEGIPGGPCYQGGCGYSYGRPPCQTGFGYGCGDRYNAYGSRCDYFREENPSACSIM